MNYAQVYLCDIANGPGMRTSLFVSGCTHHCKDCFNEVAWDFNYGKEFTEDVQSTILAETNKPYYEGITILGGEPMEVQNQKALRPFIEKFKAVMPDKTVWIYSGYTYEELTDPNNSCCHSGDTDAILDIIDVLVDGRFVASEKDISLRFRGSRNQRVIDVPTTRKTGSIVLSEYSEKEKIFNTNDKKTSASG